MTSTLGPSAFSFPPLAPEPPEASHVQAGVSIPYEQLLFGHLSGERGIYSWYIFLSGGWACGMVNAGPGRGLRRFEGPGYQGTVLEETVLVCCDSSNKIPQTGWPK